ncbi:putative integral membrane export protein [Actinacidiphila reveromycinica]|uniref:Putative integral membrane export protein n=1 Tax=Actinacidiphila reveromycinica TaxID=659352 RepID=A0A7U3V0R2_9ACTN|nr:MMPL family transporter [Streptomyces sp. SN-593]BBB02079.1 putative integral membrane export protein [Streptomyces sp. SN-593]
MSSRSPSEPPQSEPPAPPGPGHNGTDSAQGPNGQAGPSGQASPSGQAGPNGRPGSNGQLGGLGRIGAFCACHPVRVVAVWLVLLVLALGGRHVVGPTFSDKVSLPGSSSDRGADLLRTSDPAAGATTGKVVLHVGSGTVASHRQAVDESVDRLAAMPHATSVSGQTTSSDGRTAYRTVSFDVQLKTLGHGYTDTLDEAVAPARADGVRVAFGGDFDQVTRAPANDSASEAVGVVAALLILLLAFGSVLAALLPLLTAVVGVGVGVGVVSVVAGAVTFATAAPTLAVMIGLGVGIDYALFLTTRFRQDLIDGRDPRQAVARTTDSSGHAVLVAALTVAVALLSLYACGLTFIGKLGLAATLAVVVTACASLTLVPAALALVGRGIDRVAVRRRPVAETTGASDGWHRYARTVARHPVRFLAAGVTVLVVCAVPMFSMRLGHVDDGADPKGSTSRTAYDWIADAHGPGFGPGANGPFTVVVDLAGATASPDTVADDLTRALRDTPDVAAAGEVRPSSDGKILVTSVQPASAPQSAATGALFDALGRHTLPDALRGTGARAHLTGTPAAQLDFRDKVAERLPVIIGIVLVCAFVLLMAVFRSLVIPLKAVVLNLLTTGASYGVLVAVFQWGWGGGLFGLPEAVPIESYVPMMMFAIVFGLSMDYEIFLLSRISEAWRRTGDNTASVGTGLAATGRVVSGAALIMTAVFLSFTASPTVVVKMLALGLAVSVVLDATLVRLVLVPSTMFLIGRANWWLPRRLDRVLPHLRA